MEVPVEFVLKFNGNPTKYEAIVVGSIKQVSAQTSSEQQAFYLTPSNAQLGKGSSEDGLKLSPSATGRVWKGTVNVCVERAVLVASAHALPVCFRLPLAQASHTGT